MKTEALLMKLYFPHAVWTEITSGLPVIRPPLAASANGGSICCLLLAINFIMLPVRLMRAFLWISVLAWGIGLGAKLFDLLVVAGAWSAAPPESLKLMPYGPHYPMNPGHFFMPTSLVILVSSLGALIAGWNTPAGYRRWLFSSTALFIALFVFTAIVFWPMNGVLYRAGSGAAGDMSQADVIRLARRWLALDWLRVAVMAAGFFCAVRAISHPIPRRNGT